jgi:coenzyme F420-0:L-glutamate ligase
MQLFSIHTRLIRPGDNIADAIIEAAKKQKLSIEDGDLLAIASKVVTTSEKRLKKLSSVKPSRRARKLAEQYGMEPTFVEVVLKEAETVYGGVPGALLTLKNAILTANAGVDQKNAPKGYVVLWPRNSHKSAEKIRKEMFEKTGKRIGVLIIDSRVAPLRMGTIGVAIGVAGFEPVRDYRTEKDVYGKSVSITRHAIADDLASAAHLIMGESNQQTPAALIKNAPIRFREKADIHTMTIPRELCLFASQLRSKQTIEFP